MKWLWLLGITVIFLSFYVFSWMAFMTGEYVIAWPMVMGGGVGIGLITLAYFREYWI
jgi:hypothetical protein